MKSTLDPRHVQWSATQFALLSEGGIWAVPRSGLIFTRRGMTLTLTALMPHDPAMPINERQLLEQQHSDFELISRYFRAAGVTMADETGAFP